jgi:hypothetical protein
LDPGINGENPAGTTRELDLDALNENAIVVANAHDLPKAVEPPPAHRQRDAMGDGRKPSDHHELDRVTNQPIKEGLKIRQRGAPWPLSTRARPPGLGRAP